jgi:methylenetetrahydrofolate dehydrogenase (NADP+)/methenyltetrahydrofolate cyclohydrolase
MKILDGKKLSEQLLELLSAEVSHLTLSGERPPHLAAILVGDNQASKTYVGAKVKACEKVGFESSLFHLPAQTTEAELISLIMELNGNAAIDGFIVQLPLPIHIKEENIIHAIDPRKDVDGFHPVNLGLTMLNQHGFKPATPLGILYLLARYNIETEGKNVVVVGRSNIVGTPISVMLSRASETGNATVTLCHSKSNNMYEHLRRADIIIMAVGKPNFLKADMVREGVVVVDVGINPEPASNIKSGFKLVGDVDFNSVSPLCTAITPVPGGVGPMTIAALLMNTFQARTGKIIPLKG